MAALERECGLVVIEKRRSPLATVVTSLAIVGARTELISMRVLVAIPAIHRGFRKVDIPQVGFHIGWLVAISAGQCTMRTQERETCFFMIKFR